MQQAQDSFVAVLGDGTERFVSKGEVFPDSHELVKRDGKGLLFRPMDLGEENPPVKPRAPRAAGKTS
jgi:hypothetical protein